MKKGGKGVNLGRKHSEEYGINVSIRLTGYKQTKEHIENSRIGHIGKFSGKKSSNYKELYYEYLINRYLNGLLIDELLNSYNIVFNDNLKRKPYQRFLDILDWPLNSLKLKKKAIYLDFVEENKHKIDWYIENYKRLEEEYFEKLHYERHKEFFDTNK